MSRHLPHLLSTFIALGSFTMPVTSFAFSDVSDLHLYNDAILQLEAEGVIGGYQDGTFKPNSTLNRAEMTKMLIEAVYSDGEIESCSYQGEFSDVRNTDWFAPYVCVAKKEGIVDGYPDGSFKPANSINFAELAKIAVLTTDANASLAGGRSEWYVPYVQYLGDKEAIPFTIERTYSFVNRGEVSELLARLLYGKTGRSLSYSTQHGRLSLPCNYGLDVDVGVSAPLAPLKIADKQTIEVLFTPDQHCSGYAKDKDRVYFHYINVEGADPTTFSSVGAAYGKDSRRAYFQQDWIPSVDLSTFSTVGSYLARDRYAVFSGTDKIVNSNGANLYVNEELSKEIDIPVLIDSLVHYYEINIDILEDQDETWDEIGREFEKREIALDGVYVYIDGDVQYGSDPASFEIINDYYAKDKYHAYYEGHQIVGSHGTTFVLLNDMYSRDKNHVYMYGRLIDGVDVQSFQVFAENPAIGADKSHVYYEGKIISNIDVNTFEILSYGYAIDANGVYFIDGRLAKELDADPTTFEVSDIDPFFGHDSKKAYYHGIYLNVPNPADIVVLGCQVAKDDTYVYLLDWWLKIDDMDTASLQLVGQSDDGCTGIRDKYRTRMFSTISEDAYFGNGDYLIDLDE